MKQWERIVYFLALLFAVFSVVGELFFPASFRFIFDDLFFPFGLLMLFHAFFKKPEWRWIILACAALSAWGGVSDLIANGTIRITPIGMWVRWLKWPIILIAVAELSQLKVQRKHVDFTIQFVFLALAGINILMILNPFGLGEWLSGIYSAKPDVILSNYHEFGAFRLSGTTMNPNNNAIIFGLFLLYFLHIDTRKYWKYILLAFVLVFLTQSRTVLLVELAIMALYVLRANSRKTNFILISTGILALLGGLWVFRSTNLVSLVDGSAMTSNSWTSRMDHYNVLFQSNPIDLMFGHGIVLDPLAAVGFHFDTEYLSIGYQYGLIGLLIWIAAIFTLFFKLRKADVKSTLPWGLLLFIFGIANTNFTFLNVECATIMMVLLGAWLFHQRNHKLDENPEEKTE